MNDPDVVSIFFLSFCVLLIFVSVLVAWRGKSYFD